MLTDHFRYNSYLTNWLFVKKHQILKIFSCRKYKRVRNFFAFIASYQFGMHCAEVFVKMLLTLETKNLPIKWNVKRAWFFLIGNSIVAMRILSYSTGLNMCLDLGFCWGDGNRIIKAHSTEMDSKKYRYVS